jgi:hypothetical protein
MSCLRDHSVGFDGGIEVCDGAIKASDVETDAGSVPYEDGAIVPRGNWRSSSRIDEVNPNFVFVIEVPKSLISPMRHFKVGTITSQTEADEAASSDEYRVAASEFINELAVFAVTRASISILGISVKAPGLLTVTVDQKKQRRIGLHLDVWDKLTLQQKSDARWRVNVNLGSEPRHLVFCGLPVPVMHRRAALDSKTVGTSIGRNFFERFPFYPLYRISIKPGHAYVAPTDLLIHDATTLDRTTPDISIAVLGHFRLTTTSHENPSDKHRIEAAGE